MPRIGSDSTSHEPLWTRSSKTTRKYLRKGGKNVMKSYSVEIPVYDMPIRLRPWFLVFTSLVMVLLAFLGFTNFARALPINDKLLHFFCLMVATGVFYFIFDVEEDARRIWFWRYSPLIFTGVICFFFGGIVSEIVQSLLPYKEFQIGDVIANLLGSSIGLCVAYYIEKYYRYRREISRLYRPLDTEAITDEEDDDDEYGTQLLPTHNNDPSRITAPKVSTKQPSRLADVWDEREELFDIGGDSDDEDAFGQPSRPPHPHEHGSVTPPEGPKIIITSSD